MAKRPEEKESGQLTLPFQLQLRLERQLSPVADEVSALVAVVRPILAGTLYALKEEVVRELGAYGDIKLKMLGRLYKRGDGDCGICFEYAVHDALNRREPSVLERVDDALTRHCKVTGAETGSLLFGAEKTGRLELIDTTLAQLTEESTLLAGSRGRPVKLIRHIDQVVTAFRQRAARELLPQSISGLWKADLFVGHNDTDRWVGTTVKINKNSLEAGRGLRIGIVPANQGASDAVQKDDRKNLIVCPIPYDGAFMEMFYRGFGIVQQFIAADGQLPREAALPLPADRQVAKLLADRREFAVLDVIEALGPLAQPQLLRTTEHEATISERRGGESKVGAALSPMPTLFEK